jgi:glycosyltransferase involved in cell wall biosynthesis
MSTTVNAELIAALESWSGTARLSTQELRIASDRLTLALDRHHTLHHVWLTLSVLGRGLPSEAEVRAFHRTLLNEGAAALLTQLGKQPRLKKVAHRQVELLHDAVIVDVRHTAETDLATGIQRVARETSKRWSRSHDITLVTWTADGSAMRRLLPAERATALDGVAPVYGKTRSVDMRIVIPVGGLYLLPELAAEPWRTERLAAMAEFGGLKTGVIGFDCVPLTTAETVGDGMPGAFARNLSAVAKMDRVAAISDAAAVEYSGWLRMLSSSGVPGPSVDSVLLAAEPGKCTVQDEREFAQLVALEDAPLVLVVGSHEPRKNHLAILQAAELAWREGLQFRLIFVGGNAWNSLDFTDALASLRAKSRSVDSVSALPDRLLWAAYRLSRFTIFTSINEGFGLPVAESLASGTPVITSNHGSMKQIVAAGGAIVVDPRDDDDILQGIRSMITDEKLYARLRAEAADYVIRPWDDYASELWDYFMGRKAG